MRAAGGELNALVNRAGRWTGRLARAGWLATGRVPGGQAMQQQVRRFERALRSGADTGTTPWTSHDSHQGTTGQAEESTALRSAMAELLHASIEHSTERSKQNLFHAILRQLLPDEARILAALSDGSRFPVMHVRPRGSEELTLRNASTVGKSAGVAATFLVPHYLSRLDAHGLLRFSVEEDELSVQYDILLTDEQVQQAVERARDGRRLAPHVQRQVVSLSELGEQFWRACDPTGETDTGARVMRPKAGS